MLHGELVIGTRNRPFQKAPNIFNSVGMNVTTCPFFLNVVYSLMHGVVVANSFVGWEFVRNNDFGIRSRMLFKKSMKGLSISFIDDLQPNFPASLDDTNHDSLVLEIGSSASPTSPNSTTDIGLVTLYCPVKLSGGLLCHGCPNPMAQEPSRFVGHPQDSFHLVCGEALLRFNREIDSHEPFAKGQMSIVPNGARCH